MNRRTLLAGEAVCVGTLECLWHSGEGKGGELVWQGTRAREIFCLNHVVFELKG